MPGGAPPIPPFALSVVINAGPAQLAFPHVLDDIAQVVIYGGPVEHFLPSLGTRLAVLPGTAITYTDTRRPGWPATYYRVSIVDALGNESVPIEATNIVATPDEGAIPTARLITLHGVKPNPFNPKAVLEFSLNAEADVVVDVFDLAGRWVADVLRARLAAGPHDVTFAPRTLPSGTYVARIRAGGETESTKILLLK